MNEFTIKPSRARRAALAFFQGLAVLLALALMPIICVGTEYGCRAGDNGEKALEQAGYRDIQLGGRAWFACSKDDGFSSHFTATNPRGQRVSGVVCCGLIKSCTIRF